MRWLALALLACACTPSAPASPADGGADTGGGSGVDPNDGARSGSRLKLTWYVFSDGTRQWDSFYDAERKEQCSISATWADGNAYCVPQATGYLVYADAACTQKLAQVYSDPNCAAASDGYVIDYNNDGCTYTPAHLYLRGAKVSTTTYYLPDGAGGCAGPYSDTFYAYYQVGAEVPTSQLVKLTLSGPSGAGRIGQRYFQSSDGMQFPWTLHDALLGADCSGYAVSDDATSAACTPDASYTYDFHDGSCTQPEVELGPACATPHYAALFPQTACPSDTPTFYPVGAQLPNTPLYTQSGGTCSSTTAVDGDRYFATGTALELAQLSRAPDAVAGRRLQLVHYTTADGLRSRDFTLYDTQKATTCYPTTLPDGTMRCIAFGPAIDTYYRDAACTDPVQLAEIYTGPAGCAAPTIPKYGQVYISPAPGTCTYGEELHAISTPYAGTVYSNASGTCAVYTPYEGEMYSVGPAVPLTDFVTATISIDP